MVYTISTWMKLNETESYGGIIGKGNGGGETNYSFLLWFLKQAGELMDPIKNYYFI